MKASPFFRKRQRAGDARAAPVQLDDERVLGAQCARQFLHERFRNSSPVTAERPCDVPERFLAALPFRDVAHHEREPLWPIHVHVAHGNFDQESAGRLPLPDRRDSAFDQLRKIAGREADRDQRGDVSPTICAETARTAARRMDSRIDRTRCIDRDDAIAASNPRSRASAPLRFRSSSKCRRNTSRLYQLDAMRNPMPARRAP